MSEPVDLFTQQEQNRRRSQWLIVGFLLFFAWLGFGGDWLLHEYTTAPGATGYRHTIPWLGIVMSAVAIGLVWHAWTAGPSEVLWSVGAEEIVRPRTPEEFLFTNVVDEMAIASGLPRPRTYIIADADPNAFATGIAPESAAIAVTQGLLTTLNRDELQAVVGHEMGHIKNLDVRLMTLLAGLVGAIALLSDGIMRLVFQTAGRGGRGSRGGGGGDKKGGLGPLLPILLAVWILSWVLAPIASRLLALGVSRKREYLADAMAAQFTRNPMALASALEKIEHAHAPTSSIKRGAAHLCIADPLGRRVGFREGKVADLLATHPPMGMRIARLRAMAYQEMKRAGNFPTPVGS